MKFKFQTIFSFLFTFFFPIYCITFEDDTKLTKQQATALDKLKARVLPKLKHDYQKEGLFLLRYLRARRFDVNKAEEYLQNQMKWRAEQKMEAAHEEDWSDMSDFGIKVEGEDREGRPLIFWDLGDWNIRKGVLSGKQERMIRWTFKNWDQGRRKVHELELQGRNVTRWTVLVDVKNINTITNANPASLPFYTAVALGYDVHFLNLGDKIYVINCPGLFETILNLLKPAMDPITKAALQVFGKNENEWEPVVRAAIDPSQLPKRYGETKED